MKRSGVADMSHRIAGHRYVARVRRALVGGVTGLGAISRRLSFPGDSLVLLALLLLANTLHIYAPGPVADGILGVTLLLLALSLFREPFPVSARTTGLCFAALLTIYAIYLVAEFSFQGMRHTVGILFAGVIFLFCWRNAPTLIRARYVIPLSLTAASALFPLYLLPIGLNSHTLSSILGCLLLTIGLVLITRCDNRKSQHRWMHAMFLLVTAIALVFGNRSFVLIMLLAHPLYWSGYFFLRNRLRTGALVATVGLLVGAPIVLLGTSFSDAVETTFGDFVKEHTGNRLQSGREVLRRYSLAAISEFPWLGHGPGAALDVMAQPAFVLEPIADGAAFAKRTRLAPGDTLELAVHAKNARRLAFKVRHLGPQGRYEFIRLPNASTSEPCYDGDGGDAIADYPARTGCPSSHIQRGWFSCRSSDGTWLASANSHAECRWYTLRQPNPPTLLLPPIVGPQPAPVIRELHGRRYVSFANWTYNVEVPISEDWSNGFYEFVSFSPDGVIVQDSAPFVVEDRSAPEPVCIVASYLTAAAYNTGFGASLYKGFDGRAYHSRLQASAVSMQRPQASYYQHIAPVVQFLEGLDVPLRYATTLSVHKDPTLLDGCRVIVLTYHPEYISARLRNALTEAIERGVHLLSFSANAVYWKVELHKDAFGHDIMMVDKKAGDLWRNQGAAFSEQSIFGAQHPDGAWGGDRTPFVVEPRTHADAAPDPGLMSHWIFEGTGLRFGDRIGDLMGGEVDTFHPSYPVPDVQERIVFLSPYYNKEGKEFMAHTSYFMRPSGQMTFHSASLRFQHALASTNEPGRKIQRMIRNILGKMLNPDDGLISKSSSKDLHAFRYAKSHLHDGRI